MNTLSALVVRIFDAPRGTDQSLQAVSMLSCLGLAISLGLVGFGFDLGGAWI
ncbi:MAG TPA: hypothetical protein VFB02_23680 [Bradyrhizobium sp.]|jgi:hypothetical protein|nr:hypothetical protein [Bradyrhizobium sp.]